MFAKISTCSKHARHKAKVIAIAISQNEKARTRARRKPLKVLFISSVACCLATMHFLTAENKMKRLKGYKRLRAKSKAHLV